jgi:hypothetical protein
MKQLSGDHRSEAPREQTSGTQCELPKPLRQLQPFARRGFHKSGFLLPRNTHPDNFILHRLRGSDGPALLG